MLKFVALVAHPHKYQMDLMRFQFSTIGYVKAKKLFNQINQNSYKNILFKINNQIVVINKKWF